MKIDKHFFLSFSKPRSNAEYTRGNTVLFTEKFDLMNSLETSFLFRI